MTFAIVTSIQYWSTVNVDLIKIYRWDNIANQNFGMFMMFLHLIPLITVVTNFMLTDVAFSKRDITLVMATGLLYIAINFIVSKLINWNIYPFITWHDLGSLFAAIMFIILLMGVYIIVVIISSIIPKRGESLLE